MHVYTQPIPLAPVDVDPTERFSFLSHALGALAAMPALIVLLTAAQSTLAAATVAIYGASLIALLVNSSLHHAIHPASEAGRRVFRRMDHISIYVVIAGTYTPVALVGLGGFWGWAMFATIWGLCAAGILTKVFWLHAPRWLSTAFYIVMGWTVLWFLGPLVERFPWDELRWVFAGGVVYSVGAAIYAVKKPDLFPRWMGFHGLWHVFVLVAAGLHWWFVYAFVVR